MLNELSFDEFVEIIFCPRDPSPNFRSYDPAMSDKYQYGHVFGANSAKNLIKLFNRPEFLLEKYASEHLKNGFEVILGWLCTVRFRGILWYVGFPLSLRQELIKSMYDLFLRLFAANPINHTCFMWWDVIGYGYYMEEGTPADEDGAEIQKTMFETLKRILEIDSEECQTSALHGLGHLKYAGTEEAVNDFLTRHEVSDQLREYSHKCIVGTMG